MSFLFASFINDAPGNASAVLQLADQWDAYALKCDSGADEISHAQTLVPSWKGEARDSFDKSIERQRNRYINIGGDATTGSSAISTYGWEIHAAQSYIENLRYEAALLDRHLATAQITSVSEYMTVFMECYQKANVLVAEATKRIMQVKRAANQCAADLLRTVHIEPVQIGKKGPNEGGQMGQLSQDEIAQIQQDLEALKNGTFDWEGMEQGYIGDCYYLASLAALAQTPEGQAKLAAMIRPHYDENGDIDGFLVDVPTDPDNPNDAPGREVFVHSKYLNGATQGGRVGAYSILEAAWGQNHPGGSNDSDDTPPGMTSGLPANTLKMITGNQPELILSSPTNSAGYSSTERDTIIAASAQQQPIVSSTSSSQGDFDNHGVALVEASVGGQEVELKLYKSHAYTMVSADENGVTLCNPHNRNRDSSDNEIDATFTISWETYEKYYGRTTIGSTS